MQQAKKGLVLLLGVTGKTGFHIANVLIENKYPVRVIVRKRSKFDTLFDIKQVAFESVIECEDLSSQQGQQILLKAFDSSREHGPIKTVICASGSSGRSDSVETAEYTIPKALIDNAVACSAEKFVLVSTSLITKSWHPISILLNWLVPGVMHWKTKTENYLRESGLNYTIVRPGGLNGAYNDRASAYELGQGDNIATKGTINRATVAHLVVDGLDSSKLPVKCTYECISTKQQRMTNYFHPEQEEFSRLKQDDEKSIVTANHNLALKVVRFTFFGSIFFGLSLLLQKFG